MAKRCAPTTVVMHRRVGHALNEHSCIAALLHCSTLALQRVSWLCLVKVWLWLLHCRKVDLVLQYLV